MELVSSKTLRDFVESLGFVIYEIMSSANKDIFTSFFPIWMPFYFFLFLCLLALGITSHLRLNRIGEGGYPCLVPDLRGKVFRFHC